MKKILNLWPVIFLWGCAAQNLPAQVPDLSPYTADHPDWYGKVLRVADGDTFYIRFYTDEVAVRLKGVDTPETKDRRRAVQFWGPEASEYTKALLAPGTVVRLDFQGDMVDGFGRLLAYVWVWTGTEWRSVQEDLLKSGMAFLYMNYPFEYPEEFFQYQQEAQRNEAGLWGQPERIENKVVTSKEELGAVAWFKRRLHAGQDPVPAAEAPEDAVD